MPGSLGQPKCLLTTMSGRASKNVGHLPYGLWKNFRALTIYTVTQVSKFAIWENSQLTDFSAFPRMTSLLKESIGLTSGETPHSFHNFVEIHKGCHYQTYYTHIKQPSDKQYMKGLVS